MEGPRAIKQNPHLGCESCRSQCESLRVFGFINVVSTHFNLQTLKWVFILYFLYKNMLLVNGDNSHRGLPVWLQYQTPLSEAEPKT